MSGGGLAVRVTIWVALSLYAAGELARVRWRRDGGGGVACGRWVWTFGCAFYLAHVVLAFAVFHGWSHSLAYEFTARQTGELTGWDWGGGIYVNYLFSALWLAETIQWWRAPDAYRRRSRPVDLAIRLCFAFMVLNGAVIFVAGPQRWLGILIFAALAYGFVRFRR